MNRRVPEGGTERPLGRPARSSLFVFRGGIRRGAGNAPRGPGRPSPCGSGAEDTVAELSWSPTAVSGTVSGTCPAWSRTAKPGARAGCWAFRSAFWGPGPPQGLGGLRNKPGRVCVLWGSCPPTRKGRWPRSVRCQGLAWELWGAPGGVGGWGPEPQNTAQWWLLSTESSQTIS